LRLFEPLLQSIKRELFAEKTLKDAVIEELIPKVGKQRPSEKLL
jgi:hypothetical protein